MDKHGATPESLVDNIKNWKNKVSELGKPNARAPKFFYTVPTGQNPTGIVVPLSRKKEIYKVVFCFVFLTLMFLRDFDQIFVFDQILSYYKLINKI